MFDLNLSIGRNAEAEISPGACDSRACPSSGPDLVTRELFPARPDGPVHAKKSRRGPRSRSSQYRGVTFYRRTGRWESHIWDCGKQVYLGGFDTALAAARAYDRAAIKFRGVEADINFNLSDYDDMKQMMNLSKEEFVQLLRRQSNGFWRGGCKYRGLGLPGNKGYNQAAVTNFESCVYNVVSNEGIHNLDLNLGTPEVRNSAALEVNADSGNTERLISHRPLEGLPVTLSDHPNLWTALIPNDCPNYDEEKAGIVGSPQVLAKWARRMQSSTPDETSSSSSLSAAASGLSSMANYFNAPLFYSTHHDPNNTSTNDTSQYFSWLMPPS